ncbi:MAG: hypothetical protein H6929_02130 [Rhodoferax sp.]|nr:hypothetical protein [Rhodoferax sp.]
MELFRLAGPSVCHYLSALVAGFLVQISAHSASITQSYQYLSGDDWLTALTIINDGSPTQISEFTVYFDVTQFSNLSVVSSPATWDPLVIQPDSGIPADGFFDALVLNPADALNPGQSQNGFAVGFTYLGFGTPSEMPFDIVDSNFQVVFSGMTTVSAVPELPESVLLAMGLLVIAGQVRWRRRINTMLI